MTRQLRFEAPRESRDGPTGIEISVAARLALGVPAPEVDDVASVEDAVDLAARRTTEYAIRSTVSGGPDRPTDRDDLLLDVEEEDDDRVEQVTLGALV